MKRNVFAIILTLALAVAMVLVISPAAKADESVIIQAQADGAIAVEAGKILDLNGFDVTVAVDDALCVIDSKNTAKTGEGENVGTVKNTGAGVIVAVSQDPATKMRYLAVENGDGTYSAHPFNMTISQLGLNTVKEAICVRASFMANDKVIALIEDYGISVGGVDASAKNSYPFAANMIHAYADLTGSLASDAAIDTQKTAKAYVKIGGETVYSTYEANVTPREVLKTINKSDVAPTDTQLAAILELANNSHLSNLFTRFTGAACQHQGGTATCTAAAVCIDCDAAYGTSLGHSFGTNNPTCGVCGTENPNYVAPVAIVGHEVLGAWKDSKATWDSVGPKRTYDSDSTTTYWNPQANIHWTGEPGIIWKLNRPADLQKITLTFNASKYYFDLYTSTDGENYSFVASIDANNAAKAYTSTVSVQTTNGARDGQVCTLDGLNLQDVTHIKLLLVSNNPQSDFISIYDIKVSEEGTAGLDTSWMKPTAKINSFTVLGEWVRDQATDGSAGVRLSFDGKTTTRWNPQAKGSYAGAPGVIYRMNRPSDLKKITLTFGSANHYFDIYVSTDGETYSRVASVNASNEANAYNGNYVCTLDGLDLKGVTHIKLMLTGRSGNSDYWNFYEITPSEEGSTGLDNSWMLPVVAAKISAYEFITKGETGTGAYAVQSDPSLIYDGQPTTRWNPAFKDFATYQPGLGFHLDQKYDLTKLVLTFGNNLNTFKVLVSSDNTNFTQIAEITDVAQVDENKQVILSDLSANDVQYIRIIFTGGKGWATFHEMEIYGLTN